MSKYKVDDGYIINDDYIFDFQAVSDDLILSQFLVW